MEKTGAKDTLINIGGYLFLFTFVIPVIPFLALHIFHLLKL